MPGLRHREPFALTAIETAVISLRGVGLESILGRVLGHDLGLLHPPGGVLLPWAQSIVDKHRADALLVEVSQSGPELPIFLPTGLGRVTEGRANDVTWGPTPPIRAATSPLRAAFWCCDPQATSDARILPMDGLLDLLASIGRDFSPHIPVFISAAATVTGVILGDRLRRKSQQEADRSSSLRTTAAALLGAAQQLNLVASELRRLRQQKFRSSYTTIGMQSLMGEPSADSLKEHQDLLRRRESELRSLYSQEHAALRIIKPELAAKATELRLDRTDIDFDERASAFADAVSKWL